MTVLDYPWVDTNVDWEKVAEQRQQTLDDQNAELVKLQAEISKMNAWQDIAWPLVFFAGLLCGVGFGWFM